ncbi:hypothetical protein C8R44DRAFT_879356 [Mycena epipterygia]|nr:hypothetical protein C8R44DRAFT_879356 [Mycena epipterygia]
MASLTHPDGLHALRVRHLAAMCVPCVLAAAARSLIAFVADESGTSGTKPLPSAPLASPTIEMGMGPFTPTHVSCLTSSPRTAPALFRPPSFPPRYRHKISRSKSATPTMSGAANRNILSARRASSSTGTRISPSPVANWPSVSLTFCSKASVHAPTDVVAPVPAAAPATANISPFSSSVHSLASKTSSVESFTAWRSLPTIPFPMNLYISLPSPELQKRGGEGAPPSPRCWTWGSLPALLDMVQQRFGAGRENSLLPRSGGGHPRCWTKSSSVRQRGPRLPRSRGSPPALLDQVQQRFGAGNPLLALLD